MVSQPSFLPRKNYVICSGVRRTIFGKWRKQYQCTVVNMSSSNVVHAVNCCMMQTINVNGKSRLIPPVLRIQPEQEMLFVEAFSQVTAKIMILWRGYCTGIYRLH